MPAPRGAPRAAAAGGAAALLPPGRYRAGAAAALASSGGGNSAPGAPPGVRLWDRPPARLPGFSLLPTGARVASPVCGGSGESGSRPPPLSGIAAAAIGVESSRCPPPLFPLVPRGGARAAVAARTAALCRLEPELRVHHTLLCCCRLASDSSNGAITFEKLIKRRTQPIACHPRGDPSRRVSCRGAGTRGIARGRAGARRGWPPLSRGRFFQLSRRQHGNLGAGRLFPAPPIGGAAVCSGSRIAKQGCSGPSAPRGASMRLPAAGGGGRGSEASQGRCGTHPTDNNRCRTATCSSGCASERAALERGCKMGS